MTLEPLDVFGAANLGELRDVSPISVGLSGAATYLVRTSAGDFVLKMQPGDLGTWNHATSMQRLAAQAGIAPLVVYADTARAASISVKVEGLPLAQVLADPSLRARAITDVVQRLRALHAIQIPADAEMPNMSALADSIWKSQVARAGFPSWPSP
jgi:hypothetical protein